MRLDRVEISNYRSIQSATLEFDPPCRILIGRNEGGKTNLLLACALLDPSATVTPADLRETRDNESPVKTGYVRFIFQLSSLEIAEIKKHVNAKIIGVNEVLCETRGRKVLAGDFVGEFSELLYVVDIPSGRRSGTYWSKSSYSLASGWLTPKAGTDFTIEAAGKQFRTTEVDLIHESLLPIGLKDHFEQASWETVVGRYGEFIVAYGANKYPKCLFWKYSDSNLLPSAIDIESFKNNPVSCEPLRSMFLLAEETKPAEAINAAQQRPNGLKNLLTRVARAANKHVRERWKELGGDVEIVLTPNGGQIDAAIRDSYNEYAFARRSDGFKRFISFLIMVSARTRSKDLESVFFIQDEPDLALHPSGIKNLLNELLAISRDNYVLLSTHSIFMVDKDRIDRHVVVEKSKEVTTLKKVDRSAITDEEVLFNALGYSAFEQIKPVNLVFEGWRDKKLFSTALKRGRKDRAELVDFRKNVGLVHAMGVKDISKVITYMDAMARKSIVVTDGDRVAREKQQQYRNEKPDVRWLRYDETLEADAYITAEDFIIPERLRSGLKTILVQQNKSIQVPDKLFEDEAKLSIAAVNELLLSAPNTTDVVVKDLVNRWKSEIFDKLKVSEIREEYSKVVTSLVNEAAKSYQEEPA